MTDSSTVWLPLLGVAALCIPLTYGLAALVSIGVRPFRLAGLAGGLGLGLALLVAGGWALATRGEARTVALPPGSEGWLALTVRLDVVTSAMLVLVCFIALIIVRFSRTYLQGDSGQARYVRWLMATLAAVTLLVVSNNLLVIWLAWVGTSLSLHQLLTFYALRPQAIIVAHKKFLVSRVADVSMAGALCLIWLQVGSLDLDALHAWAGSVSALPLRLEAAAVLLVVGASLKCAQLPFHGWLIQVMEAPTPVSALLHAGVVNLGGLLMIRLAPLMVKAEPAQTLLVVIGCVTAVVAALVMTTRVSVKVMLAWSTCAQMGFMLVQCGLGAYSLALLHLLAHSLYKAHAFLSSGSAVDGWRAQALVAPKARAGLAAWLAAAAISLCGVAAVGAVAGASPGQEPALWALAVVLSLALTPLLVRGAQQGGRRLAMLALSSVGVAALYFTWHGLFAHLLAAPAHSAYLMPRLVLVGASFAGLFLVQAVMASQPEGRLARALYPRLFAGLYLDEVFMSLTFRLWRPRLQPRVPHGPPLHVVKTLEA